MPDDLSSLPPMLKIPEAAPLLGIGVSTLWKLVRSGEIPSGKLGDARRIRRADLLELVGASEPTAAAS